MVDRDGGPVDTVGNGFHQVIGGIQIFLVGHELVQFGAKSISDLFFCKKQTILFGMVQLQRKRTKEFAIYFCLNYRTYLLNLINYLYRLVLFFILVGRKNLLKNNYQNQNIQRQYLSSI